MAKHTAKRAGLVPPSAMAFLLQLKKNNHRNWFNEHKERFLVEQQNIEIFADTLLALLGKHDVIETPSGKKSLYRIYRDTRFSNNKTPYKINWSGSFTRATKYRRGSYYFHIQPGNSFVAGGFWLPNPADLKRIRDDIAFDAAPLRKIINAKLFVSTFGTLQGERVKTTPRGSEADHEAIDLLRQKQFLLIRKFTDEEVLAADFVKQAASTFKSMRPFFDYMSSVLTTDTNGVEV